MRIGTHTHLCIDQYLSVITFHRDMLQGGYSPLSLYYNTLCTNNRAAKTTVTVVANN